MNKNLILGLLGLFWAPLSPCAVTFRMADPNTLLPLSMEEVVVGTPISLVIYSDANEPWKGGLFIRGEDRSLSRIAGRGLNPNLRHYQGSCMDGAGAHARAMYWKDSNLNGFDFYTNGIHVSPGDWFVVDYVPLEAGLCQIEFYEYIEGDPNCWDQVRRMLVLDNTPSRDFSGDGVVNFADFAQFSSVWQDSPCSDPYWCLEGDLNRDGLVGLGDLLMFSEYWLWGTPGWKPAPGPTDPNIIYRITDGMGADEIDLAVGDSVTLYIHKTTLDKEVKGIYLEAILSDPSLGWIDNTEYDPNNPSGCCSAQILASPRDAIYDYWGPALMQQEGIEFYTFCIESAIEDGPVASFVYTATAAGDMNVTLVDLGSVPSSLQGILIHQSEALMMMSQPAPEAPAPATVEETVELLETIWVEEPEVRQTISEDQWIEFIENVKEQSTESDDSY